VQADPAAQLVDIGLQGHVAVQGLAAEQHGGQLAADLDLFRLVDLVQ
jgi:hypothetical protein